MCAARRAVGAFIELMGRSSSLNLHLASTGSLSRPLFSRVRLRLAVGSDTKPTVQPPTRATRTPPLELPSNSERQTMQLVGFRSILIEFMDACLQRTRRERGVRTSVPVATCNIREHLILASQKLRPRAKKKEKGRFEARNSFQTLLRFAVAPVDLPPRNFPLAHWIALRGLFSDSRAFIDAR